MGATVANTFAAELMSDEPSCSNVLDPQLPRYAWLVAGSLSIYFPEIVFTDPGITLQLHSNMHRRQK